MSTRIEKNQKISRDLLIQPMLPSVRYGAVLFTALLATLASIMPNCTRAADQLVHGWNLQGEAVPRVVIILNKSRTYRLDKAFSTAVMGNPEIADAMPMSDHSIYIQGKKIGTTNVTVFDKGGKLVALLDVEVALDAKSLQEKIQSSTGSRGIRVSSNNGQVVLSGSVNDAVTADRAMALAKGFAPNVVNALSIAASQQVLLKVRFFEASRDAGRQLGVNWYGANATNTRGVNIGAGSVEPQLAAAGIPLFQTAGTLAGTASQPFGVVLAELTNRGTSIDVLVTALETQGLIRRLAEPNLMALSGDTARFLAGGEFPVPIASATGSTGLVTPTIEYKPFGVRLSFTPTVLANGIINLRITPEVSELDFSNAVTISGTTVPSLIKRDATTTVELRDGQSFAIAGLMQSNNLRNRDQIPWLGSVPVLGTLFSSAGYQKHETELVIIVTPQLVQPVALGQPIATPLDNRLSSNDGDFFLLNKMDVPKNYSYHAAADSSVTGPYGHILPVEPKSNE